MLVVREEISRRDAEQANKSDTPSGRRPCRLVFSSIYLLCVSAVKSFAEQLVATGGRAGSQVIRNHRRRLPLRRCVSSARPTRRHRSIHG